MKRVAPLLKLLKSVQYNIKHSVNVCGIQTDPVGSVAADHAVPIVLRRDIEHIIPYLPRSEQQTHTAYLHFSGGDLVLRLEPFQPIRNDPHTQLHSVLLRSSAAFLHSGVLCTECTNCYRGYCMCVRGGCQVQCENLQIIDI